MPDEIIIAEGVPNAGTPVVEDPMLADHVDAAPVSWTPAILFRAHEPTPSSSTKSMAC